MCVEEKKNQNVLCVVHVCEEEREKRDLRTEEMRCVI